MDALVTKLGELGGVWGILCALQFLAIVYLYRRIEALQKEHVDTLKSNIPVMERFESTLRTALSVVSKAGGNQ